VTIGESREWSFVISNEGSGDLTVESVSTEGAYFSDSIDGGFTLTPGEEVEVMTMFEPAEAGQLDGQVVITSDDPDEDVVIVQLSGTGTEEQLPQIGFEPESINFGEVMTGEVAEEVLTIHNNGNADLSIEDIVVEGDGFSIDYVPPQFDWEYRRTDNNMSLLALDGRIGDEQLIAGDYIGVFTPDGLCAGYSEVPEGGFGNGIGLQPGATKPVVKSMDSAPVRRSNIVSGRRKPNANMLLNRPS